MSLTRIKELERVAPGHELISGELDVLVAMIDRSVSIQLRNVRGPPD